MVLPRTGALLALVLGVTGLLGGSPAGSAGAEPASVASRTVQIPVSLVNRTPLPCAASGERTTVRGRLIGPADRLDRPETVTVYVHDIATGAWFWEFDAVPGLDFTAAMAARGQVSLVIDRPGYGASGLSHGNRTCLGAQATVLHQVVSWARSDLGAASVVLAGHSVGAAVAELEAATFHDVDGLIQMSWSDAGASPRAIAEASRQHLACLLGGDRGAGRPAYAFYAPGPDAFRSIMFHSAAPQVQAAAAALRTADPCGDALTLGPLVVANQLASHAVRAPVLLLFGSEDALNRPDAAALQQQAFTAGEVSTHVLPGTGGALPLEASASRTHALVADWLESLTGTGNSR